jgi:hypothetical protein
LSIAPTSYALTVDCITKVAYQRIEQNSYIGGFWQPSWVCVNKPKVSTASKEIKNCSATCHHTSAVHSSCYAQASLCRGKNGQQFFEAILIAGSEQGVIGGGSADSVVQIPGFLGQTQYTVHLSGKLAGCEGSAGKPSCWPLKAPTGVSDGGGPTDAVKHLQVIELLKPQIPELTYHPLMLPKSQIPDLDPNTLDILGSTFSLLNTSNPTLAKDCWLCMTTGAVMPMAIPP